MAACVGAFDTPSTPSPFLNFVQISAQKQAAEKRAEVAEDQVKVVEKRAESAEKLLARYRDRFGDLE